MRQYRSRLSEIEEQKSIKSAVIFGGLTIGVLVLVIIFGVPLLSRVLGIFSKSTPTTTNQQTQTLPAPTLSALAPYTNQKSIIVKGTTTPNATVKIFFNTSSDQTPSDDSGNFALNVSLIKGVNTIYAETIDSNGNTSLPSSSYSVNYTTQTPNLTVNVPQNNQTFYGSTQKTLTIQGSTDQGNTVTINDHIAIVDPTGKFDLSFDLQSGDNQLKIISTDQAGNKKEIDLKVTFNP